MNRMILMFALVISALALLDPAAPAWSDEVLQMPGGGTCFRQSGTGVIFGCSGGSSGSGGDSAADRARAYEAKEAGKRQEQYKDCLRTADWPNNPSRHECADMYLR